MKKNFSMMLALILTVTFSSLALCAEPAKGQPKITWRMQASFPAGEPVTYKGVLLQGNIKTFRGVFEKVAERTGGNFKINIYEPGVLVGPRDYYGALKSGAVEMIGGFGWYYSQVPIGKMDPGIFFLTSSAKQYIPIIYETGEWLKTVREAYAQHNMYYLIPSSWGGHFFLTNFPINKVDDFKGKLIRGSGPQADMLKLFGAKVTFISVAEAYTALQRGTVDGWAYSVASAGLTGYIEVTKYCSAPSYFNPNIQSFIANMDAWNKLPKNYQEILTEETMKASKFSFETSDLLDEWGMNVAAPKYGVKVINLSKEEHEKMKNLQLPLWEKYAAGDKYCAKILEIVKKAAK